MAASFFTHSSSPWSFTAQARVQDQEGPAPAPSQNTPEPVATLAADGLVLVGADGIIQVLTEPFRQLWGLPGSAAEWLGRPFAELDAQLQKHVADAAAYAARNEQLRTAVEPTYNHPLPLRDGRVLEVDFIPVGPGPGGQQLWCMRNATQREQVLTQLRELTAMPNQNPNPLLRMDVSGKSGFTNAAAQDLCKVLSAAEATVLRERLTALVQEALRTQAPQQAELASADQHFLVVVKPIADQQYANIYFTNITDQYHATRQLEEQRLFYESILNELPTEIAVFGPDQRYLYLNARCLLGPEGRQMWLGKSIVETVGLAGRTQQMADSRHALLESAVRERRLMQWEEEIAKPDGSLRHYLYFYQPVFGPAGDLTFVVAHNADITARVRAERELLEQQDFMHLVVNTVPSAISVINPQFEFSFKNYYANQLHIDLVNRANGHFEAARASFAEAYAKVLATNDEIITESQVTMANGEMRWYQNVRRPLLRANGEVHVLSVSTDITALKQAQHTLEHSEKQYRDLMHYSQALICTYDLEGTLLTVNPALSALLGRPAAELVGLCVATVLLADNQLLFADYMTRLTAEGEAKGVTRVLAEGGRAHYVFYYAYLLREPGQEPYIISHAHDITERVQAEQATQRARKEAEATARARANFLANMSHEIRTPMNGVLGIAAQLVKTRLDPQQQELVHIIRASGQHLLAVLNDVLDMAKITAGKLELEQAVFHLPNSISEALRPLAVQAQEKGLSFQLVQVPDTWPMPWVVGDSHRLKQVLLNLVSNALKFTERGSIVVRIERLQETDTALTVCLRVTDTGCGVAPDKQALIFESFTQAYANTARHYGGTGLGLSISQALVAQMGGTLTLTSIVEEGSTFAFTVTLQKAPREAPPVVATPPAPLSPGRLAGTRVLLVEDNHINRTVAQMLLEPWGVLLTEAVDGPEALELLTEQPPFDMVLLDIQLPTLSGLEVVQQLRQLPDPRRAATPVIALTANVFQIDVERYLAAGFDDYLAKPYEEAELYQKIERLLPS